MSKRILFIGAGAIGSYLGGFLSRAGHEVTLIDAWADQVESIRQSGIAVNGPHDPFVARPAAVHLHEAQRLARDFPIVFIAVKAYDTAWAAQLALRHAAAQAPIVSAQNCWPDPIVAAVTGAQRSVGLVMSRIGVALWQPAVVERGLEKGQGQAHNVFRAGEHDGRLTGRAKELAEMLSVIDGAEVTDNLWGERWSKLCANAMGNPVTAMSGLGSVEVASTKVGRALMIYLAGESARVGITLGYRVPRFNGESAERWAECQHRATWDALDAMLTAKSATGPNWRASMAQDVAKGRPTEIEYMNGHVVAQGTIAGVPTPVSAATVQIVKELEIGRRKPAPENMAEVLKRAGVGGVD